MQNPENTNILVCALEGALLKTNLKSELLIRSVKTSLEKLVSSDFDLQQRSLTDANSQINGMELPVNQDVYDFLLEQKSLGRRVLLDTSESSQRVASILSDKNIFDGIIDLSKDAAIEENFDYIGSSTTTDNIWKTASARFHVGPKKTFETELPGRFDTPIASASEYIKAIRAYQWLKNLLVFVPIITSQQLSDTEALKNTIIMFFCFSAVASFGYIVNDLLDLQSDRAHPTKHKRPFASGVLSAGQGLALGMVLLLVAAIGCFFLPQDCMWVLLGYLVLTLCYSLYLKTKLMIDVVSLGSLFTLRVIGGAEAIESDLSFYLLSFSIFLFSSLGMVKRFAELHNLQAKNKHAARGRGYRVDDMAPVRIIGISLGYMSVFILGQYINSPLITQYYDNPKVIWLLFPLLTYWLGRLWILANRGEVNEDPLIFAIKDRTSLLVAGISALILIVAN